jgi:hypothetical protein
LRVSRARICHRIEQPEQNGRKQVEIRQEPDLIDELAEAVAQDLRPRRDHREALLRQLPEELQVELGLGATPDAFEKSEDDVSRGGWRRRDGCGHCTRLVT